MALDGTSHEKLKDKLFSVLISICHRDTLSNALLLPIFSRLWATEETLQITKPVPLDPFFLNPLAVTRSG